MVNLYKCILSFKGINFQFQILLFTMQTLSAKNESTFKSRCLNVYVYVQNFDAHACRSFKRQKKPFDANKKNTFVIGKFVNLKGIYINSKIYIKYLHSLGLNKNFEYNLIRIFEETSI